MKVVCEEDLTAISLFCLLLQFLLFFTSSLVFSVARYVFTKSKPICLQKVILTQKLKKTILSITLVSYSEA